MKRLRKQVTGTARRLATIEAKAPGASSGTLLASSDWAYNIKRYIAKELGKASQPCAVKPRTHYKTECGAKSTNY